MTYEPNGEAKFQQQPDTPAPDEAVTESDEQDQIDAEAEAESDDAVETPLTPPPGGSIGADGKVYYGKVAE